MAAVSESAIISAPLPVVWDEVRPLLFEWSSAMDSNDPAPPAGAPSIAAASLCAAELRDGGRVRSGRHARGHLRRRGVDDPGAPPAPAAPAAPAAAARGANTSGAAQVLEMSDLAHSLTYELVESQPAAPSFVSKLSLKAVTNTDETFIEWETTFRAALPAGAAAEAGAQMLQSFRELDAALANDAAQAQRAERVAAAGGTPAPVPAPAPPAVGTTLLDIRGEREMVTEPARARELLQPVFDGNTSITEVRLSTKSFGDQSAAVLAEALGQLESLTVADIDDIIAGRMDAEALRVIETVCRALEGKKLVQFNASDNAFGPRGVVACKPALLPALDTLQRVYFCNNGLSEEAGRLMAEILLANGPSNLRLLHVHNNMLGEVNMTAC
eukprot:COSAG04_NODE_30_length_35898_cov_42.288053_29_plen_385_part_00